MELNMELRQSQLLSAEQIQSMEILQMSYQELLTYINEQVVENPVLEAEDLPSERDVSAQKLKWLSAEDRQNRYYIRGENPGDPLFSASVPLLEESLFEYVKAQLDALKLPESLYKAACFAAANLDENGYLKENASELAEGQNISTTTMVEAIRVIKTLEPAGVGAAGLADCLELQLSRMEGTELAMEMVRRFIEKISRNQYGHIAKALKKPESEIRKAADLIRSLNPRPGAEFYSGENTGYIRPDIIVVKFKDYFEILTGDYDFPSLHVNSFYSRLLESSDDKELLDYLNDRMRRAKWLIGCVAQRRKTLMLCTQAIIETQEDFFRGNSKGIRPLTMAELADNIGVHESTVSRAIKGKYLQCGNGVYPLSFFFSRQLGISGVSVDNAKRVMREVIEGEDKKRPLSDMQITERMKELGVEISRRTVAKYRAEMNMPNATGRKIME